MTASGPEGIRALERDRTSPVGKAPMPEAFAPAPRRLFRKYFLLVLSLVTIALLASGGVSSYFAYQESREALAALQQEKAVAAASRIEQFVQQIVQQLSFASLPQIDPGDLELRRIEFLKLLRQAPVVTDVAQIGAEGCEEIFVSRLGMDVVGCQRKLRHDDPAFRGPAKGKPWFGPVYFRKETEPYMTIALRASDNGPVTLAEVNLKFIWDVVSRIRVGDKGKAYVVDANGYLIADPDIGLVLRKTNLSKLPHVESALASQSGGALASTDLNGNPVLTAYAPIASLGWEVFVEQPIAEVYARLNASIARTGALLLAGIAISALFALALARGMTRPIRTLEEGAARIGSGDLEQRIDVRTGDELESLARTFNQMSARLYDSYADLERKVAERTAELRNALDRQTAVGEILRTISASPTDVQPVVDAVAQRAADLCRACYASVMLVDGDRLVPRAEYRDGQLTRGIPETEPVSIDRKSFTGRAVLERQPFQAPDARALVDTEFQGARSNVERFGLRGVLAVPMLREDQAYGGVFLARGEPGPFAPGEVALVETFAQQAAIAIDNVRLFREIQEKSRQLEIASKHKSDFLANMSHELRTPLNAIIGFSEVMLERLFGDINEKQEDYLRDIHASGKHLLGLINDILDLSKIEAGRMELDRSTFDLQTTLGNALTLVRERAQRHGIALELQVDPTVGEIFADERKLKQVLINLLTNAVKFTPDGGQVKLVASRAAGRVVIAVCDTGIGIAAEDHEAVFEEFRQVGGDYTRKQEGTGLGLALTRRFVELHGGHIRLESAPGKGSTFTFDIPVGEAAA